MANTFFGFDTSLNNNGDNLLPPPEDDDDDCLENEEEYDALNDETFGAMDDALGDDDWEQQHEQFAEFAENSKHSEQIENSLTQLVLDDDTDDVDHGSGAAGSSVGGGLLSSSSLSKSSVWSYTPATRNGDVFNSSILSSLQKASKTFIESRTDVNQQLLGSPSGVMPSGPATPPSRFCTVEELEKNLIKGGGGSAGQSSAAPPMPPPHRQHLMRHQQPHPMSHGPMYNMPPNMMAHQFPPRLPNMQQPPMNLPHGMSGASSPHLQHPPPPQNANHPPPHPHLPPPGLYRLIPPHLLPTQANGAGHPPRPPGFMYHHQQGGSGGGGGAGNNQQLPVNHPFNHLPPNRMNNLNRNLNHFGGGGGGGMLPQQHMHHHHPQHQQQQHYQQKQQLDGQRVRRDSNSSGHNQRPASVARDDKFKDEYAGLMTTREKQWLLNIQLLQLNTGTPYFDDYYFTVFKERKAKSNKENMPTEQLHQQQQRQRYGNNRQQQRHHNDRQENNTLTPRVYTPLQFENSLGKLQVGSVTAPRKIIDMDIVTPDKESDGQSANRDTRRIKQLLLELETLYSLLLKAEDLTNPLAISNMEKLREIKQKQRLRELELAPTPEQKQEILRLFKLESEQPAGGGAIAVETQLDLIGRILSAFLQEDKFVSFLNIRKGKGLLLRLLPHLSTEHFGQQLFDLWTRVLLSLAVVGRRDMMGDCLLPRLHPFFKRFIQSSTLGDILDMVASLLEVIRLENNSRSTPLSHQGKCPLYFVLFNRFGVSALVMMFIRTEYLISSGTTSDSQQASWRNFLIQWADLTGTISNSQSHTLKLATPIEPIPVQIFNKHCNRFDGNLAADKRQLLQEHFVDLN